MASPRDELEKQAEEARRASRRLACTSTQVKDCALKNISIALQERRSDIVAANRLDYEAACSDGMSAAMLDRLMLDEARVAGMSRDVEAIMELADPIGEFSEVRTLPNGLVIGKKRIPLGVMAAIYESRPNVTIDISSLCIKSGNALVLRGGKEAFHSNRLLAEIVSKACDQAGLPQGCVQFVSNTDRQLVDALLGMNHLIDLVVPRGGAGLINMVRSVSRIPVVAGGIGVCHIYVDRDAKLQSAVEIVFNAKTQRPTVCNALDTVLVHSSVATAFLPEMSRRLSEAGVELHCDQLSQEIVSGAGFDCKKATGEDWGREFLSLTLAVKIVESMDEALEHIEQYGSGHSEAIISQDYTSVWRFLDQVDAACVYANASTRFTDGAQFGLGAEVGISTQKMHARGPLGLKEITSYKWVIFGQGHVRP